MAMGEKKKEKKRERKEKEKRKKGKEKVRKREEKWCGMRLLLEEDISGLSAATYLEEKGWNVIVVE